MRNLLTILLIFSTAKAQTVCPAPLMVAGLGSLLLEDAPILNSYPIVFDKVLYLNFTGRTLTHPGWNGGQTLVLAHSGLTAVQMTDVFYRVKEDWYPFAVNVTLDSNRFNTANVFSRQEIILTPTNSWRQGVGGIAYLNTFTSGNTPCFGFTNLMGYVPKNVAEVTSHELGHTVNLYHQSRYDSIGNLIEAYHSGDGATLNEIGGNVGCAKIMGASYYRNKSTWSTGRTQIGFNDIQNEVDTIKKLIPFRPQTLDIVFPRQTTTIPFTVLVKSVVNAKTETGGNTDILLELESEFKDISDSLNSNIRATLDPGVYNLEVSGVEFLSPDYINSGQITTTFVFEPVVIVPIRDERFIYDRTRNEKVQYSVLNFSGQVVKKGYSELSKALDGLPNGTYVVKPESYYSLQIIKQ